MQKIWQVQQEEAKKIQGHEVIGTLQISQGFGIFVTLKSVNCIIRLILFSCGENKPYHSLIKELELAIYISVLSQYGRMILTHCRYKNLGHCEHIFIQFKESSKICRYSTTLRKNTESPLSI